MKEVFLESSQPRSHGIIMRPFGEFMFLCPAHTDIEASRDIAFTWYSQCLKINVLWSLQFMAASSSKGNGFFSINGGGKQGEEGRKIVKLDILKLFTIRKLPDLSKIEWHDSSFRLSPAFRCSSTRLTVWTTACGQDIKRYDKKAYFRTGANVPLT